MTLRAAIRSIFKRAPGRQPRRDYGFMLPRTWGRDTVPHAGDLTALLSAYRDWAYVCAQKNAVAMASVPLRVYTIRRARDQRQFGWARMRSVQREQLKRLQANAGLTKWTRKAYDIQEIEEHPAIDMLQNVNPDMNRFDLLEATGVHLDLTGTAYWYLIFNPLGIPVQIWPLRPDKMKVVKSNTSWIAGYVYEVGGGNPPIPFEPEEIIRFRYFHPTDMVNGFAPLMAAINPYNQLIHMDALENEIWLRGVMGQTAFTTETDMDDIGFERLKTEIQQTYGGSAGVNAGLLDKGVKPIQFGYEPSSIGFVEQHKIKMIRMAAAFGVPLSKLTTEDVNLANAETGEMQYQRDTIAPKLRRIEEKLNERLFPLYDEDIFCAFDDNVPEDKAHRLNEIRTRLAGAPMTEVNEERAQDGYEPLDWGNGQPSRGDANPLGFPERAGRPEREKGVSVYPRSKGLSREARRERWKAFDGVTRREEAQFKTMLSAMWPEQMREVIAKVRGKSKSDLKKLRQAAAIVDVDLKSISLQLSTEILNSNKSRFDYVNKAALAVIDSWLFDFSKWQTRFFDEGKTLIQAVVKKHGDMAADEIPLELAFDIEYPDTVKFINDKTFRFSFEVNKTSQDMLRQVLIESVNEGLSIPQIANAVEEWYGEMEKYRAVRIARTEVVGAANGGSMQMYEQSGVVEETEWIATMDSRVRDSHAELDGDRIAIGGTFVNGCRFPGDPYGPVGEIANCRCTQAAVLKGEL